MSDPADDLDVDTEIEPHVETLSETVQRYRVNPGRIPDLPSIDTRGTETWDGSKKEGKKVLEAMSERLGALQELLYAEGRQRLLVVLQATDTGGKDSTIKHVFSMVNPQGVHVASFKQPTEDELARDYLWRVHARVPQNGVITIFNRSHYEDVLIVRVHELVPEERWRRRYEHIRNFEQMLVDEGTTIVKFYLHISKDEQKERLQKRLDRSDKHWKFTTSDLAERKRWDEYQTAFTDAITETSTDDAPWYVVPADRKWYRNLVISEILIQTLEGLDMQWPKPEEGLEDVVID